MKRWLAARDWPVENGEDVLLAVSEAVSNSAEHAYPATGMPNESEPVIAVHIVELPEPDGRRIRAVANDFGVWRSPPSCQGYRGRGLRMIESLMDSCEVDHGRAGTRVTMISKLVTRDEVDGPPRAAGHASASEERMRWLEVVTDAGLAHLSVDRLLDELLDRVRLLMDVDTAAVLLLDPSRQFLVATVARGIEEEVHQGVRIPLGRGFAGRIAHERRWVSISQVNHDNVLNPILREKGIASLLGVPLVASGTVLGVLHVGTLTRRQFVEQDAELLQMVADRAALAIQSRMSQVERAAASVMQRHLLPARLPKVAGLEFASRYVTGGEGEVGGDWYDVFSLPSGAVCVVVGDVVGHGLAAAQSMSQLRAVLRSNALHTEDPAELLSRLDEHAKHFQPDTMATVLCGMLTPSSDLLRLSSAGHPPPILARPQGQATTLAIRPDLPIGVELGHRRHSTEVQLTPGSVMCLYSDGLVERRRVVVDDNIERLRRTVTPQAAETVCAEVMRKLIGIAIPEDDVAVLVVRRLRVDG